MELLVWYISIVVAALLATVLAVILARAIRMAWLLRKEQGDDG